LDFFWHRLNENGIIIVHDTQFESVRQAIAEFCSTHPSFSFFAPTTQWVLFKR
jgi:transposase